MEKRKPDTKRLATLAMLIGILLVMGMTGIGLIPLPLIKATTMHIPVILGAILLGPSAGMILGGVFGLVRGLVVAVLLLTIAPSIISLISPELTQELLSQSNMRSTGKRMT